MRTNTWLEEYNIIRAIIAGDKQQFLELVRRYQQPVFSLHCRITDSRSQAEELTCRTFAKAFRNLRRFNFTCKFENWVHTLALHLALDFMKAKDSVAEPADSLYAGTDENLAQAQRKAVQRRLLRRAIAQLGRKQQAAIYLKYFEDLAGEEISEKLGVSERRVKAIVYRARHHLKNTLTAWDYFA
jgi:RNA polymerase sigma-70 factor (ECF subfamily)